MKVPREISIPSIRDRITLREVYDFLTIRYKSTISFDLPQDMVRKVNSNLESMQHDELIKRLWKKIRNNVILSLIQKAIKSPTVSKPSKNDSANEIGLIVTDNAYDFRI